MKKVVFVLLTLCSCADNTDLEQMKKYQISADMEQMRYDQQNRDEKLRKEMKQEHKDDILFNLAVTKEQVNIDNHKFDMINRYHIDGSEHLTWDNVDRYNQMLNKDRARLENEDGISRPDDIPSDSPPNDPDQYKEDQKEETIPEDKTDKTSNQNIQTNQEEPKPDWTPQHYSMEYNSNRTVKSDTL